MSDLIEPGRYGAGMRLRDRASFRCHRRKMQSSDRNRFFREDAEEGREKLPLLKKMSKELKELVLPLIIA